MEENKNLETEVNTEEVTTEEEFDIAEVVKADKKQKNEKKKSPKKEKLIKNQALFKKGGYSITITAIVIIGAILLNVLVGALAQRFVLEFDMTSDKINSISEDNIKYIKNIDKEIDVIVCAAEESYIEYVGTVAQQYYGVTYDSAVAEYYAQTITLVKRYGDYNNKINVQFIDPQSNEFATIVAEYGSDNLAYGDIIVSCKKDDGKKRFKRVAFEDIYLIQQDETYASMGMNVGSVAGNNLENALTGALAYVLSDTQKKVAMLTGHSPADCTESYKTTLESNNFLVENISTKAISKISSDYDLIVIPGPTKDFIESEINAISEFLDNDGKLGKGMIVFADATAPYLKNFYDFLTEWGVKIEEGVVFETDENYHIPEDPTTFVSYNTGADSNLSDLSECITGTNVPMTLAFEKQDYIAAASIVETTGTTVKAPRGAGSSWADADSADAETYSTLIETVKTNNDEDETRVSVFSSVEFLTSTYNELEGVHNKEFTYTMAERAVGLDEFGFSFISKSITNDSFMQTVSQSAAYLIRNIFMFILPIAIIVLGVVVYIRRRNAE